MYALIVQGIDAGVFQFRNNSGQEFRDLIESMTLSRSMLICSAYRIDLIYQSKENIQDTVIKLWCKIVGTNYSEEISKSFLKSSEEVSTLGNYFISLKNLSNSPYAFNLYRSQFHKVISQEPNHPIHKRLMESAAFLSEKRQFNFLKQLLTIYPQVIKPQPVDAKQLANSTRKSYLTN